MCFHVKCVRTGENASGKVGNVNVSVGARKQANRLLVRPHIQNTISFMLVVIHMRTSHTYTFRENLFMIQCMMNSSIFVFLYFTVQAPCIQAHTLLSCLCHFLHLFHHTESFGVFESSCRILICLHTIFFNGNAFHF